MARIVGVVLIVMALVSPGAALAQTAAPPTLLGEHFFASVAPFGGPGSVGSVTITSANCDPSGTSTFTFTATGEASIAYTGTFTESGTVTIGPQVGGVGPVTSIDTTFTVDSISPPATITGEKHLAPGSGATGVCDSSGQQASGVLAVDYSATITPAGGGQFSDHGTADFGVTSTAIQTHFLEAFFSDQTETTPVIPTSKEQCKNGGWRAFGFKNQGQCIKAVNHGP
jgi:hypothetical protein